MPFNNPFVKSIRPNSYLEAYLDTERSYHISFGEDNEGKVIARTTVNGHEFIAKSDSRGSAGRQLTQTIEAAEKAGKTLNPPEAAKTSE